MSLLDLTKLEYEELDELKHTILGWVERRCVEAPSPESAEQIQGFMDFVEEIESEQARRPIRIRDVPRT